MTCLSATCEPRTINLSITGERITFTVIHYNNIPLRWVDSFRYLGVNIHRTNNLSKGLKLTCHQAKKAQSTLDMHTSSHPTVSLNHIFELFDCLIKPVLTCGCAVWGSGNIAEIEKCHLSL